MVDLINPFRSTSYEDSKSRKRRSRVIVIAILLLSVVVIAVVVAVVVLVSDDASEDGGTESRETRQQAYLHLTLQPVSAMMTSTQQETFTKACTSFFAINLAGLSDVEVILETQQILVLHEDLEEEEEGLFGLETLIHVLAAVPKESRNENKGLNSTTLVTLVKRESDELLYVLTEENTDPYFDTVYTISARSLINTEEPSSTPVLPTNTPDALSPSISPAQALSRTTSLPTQGPTPPILEPTTDVFTTLPTSPQVISFTSPPTVSPTSRPSVSPTLPPTLSPSVSFQPVLPRSCNGLRNLCYMPANEVLFAMMHNADSYRAVAPFAPVSCCHGTLTFTILFRSLT
jgi:hypothetical protein